MKKFSFLLIPIIFLFVLNTLYAHVAHYKKINFLKYDLLLNGKLIGNHAFNFKKDKNFFYVNSSGAFKVDKLGVVLMDYKTKTEEVYNNNGQLIKFNSKTHQNKKEKFAKILLNENNLLNIDGSSFKGETERTTMVGSWWNHEIVSKNKQISPISGRIIKQKVKFLGKERIIINKKEYEALHFHFLSDDNKPLSKKKLNIHVWYDANTLLWIKASYNKLGKWEYLLSDKK